MKSDNLNTKSKKHIMAAIEALLFASGDPVSLSQLADILELEKNDLKEILNEMKETYQGQGGIMMREMNESYTLCTKPEFDEYIRLMVEPRSKQGLSPAAFETLAIIAYNQPITRAGIEEIRGVNSDSSVTRLLEKNLISEAGRKEVPGRPMQFETTEAFLKSFGFSSLNDLPSINFEEIKQIENENIE